MSENILGLMRIQPEMIEEHTPRRALEQNIPDPYRWMETDDAVLGTWKRAQHERTAAALAALPMRAGIEVQLRELHAAGSLAVPVARGGRLFYWRRERDQDLPVLYVEDEAGGGPRVLLDQNDLSLNSTSIVYDVFLSRDGSRMAYRLSESGSSLMSLHVLDVDSGALLPDVIPAEVNPVAHSWPSENGVAWTPDCTGFYYSRSFQSRPAGEERYHQRIFFHRLGDAWTDDALVFGADLRMEQLPCPQLSADGRYLVVVVLDLAAHAAMSEIHVCDLEHPGRGFVAVAKGLAAQCDAQIGDGWLILKSNQGAPRMKLEALDLATIHGERMGWRTVLPEGRGVIGRWTVAGARLVVETMENVCSRLRVYDLSGNCLKTVELPEFATVEALSAGSGESELFFSCSSWLLPTVIYRLDLGSLECSIYRRLEALFEAEEFTARQVWYASFDGERIPMFLAHRKGLKLDGNNPAVVHGYGGFGVSLRPGFKPSIVPFLRAGGVYAVANVRGGGEFGEDWRRAGARENKQTAIDDFNAAAKWLISAGFTKPSRLACYGWSNGGMLVNAAAQQEPGLWRAVVAGAPVADMARFHLFHSGRHWISEYGSPEAPAELAWLLRYSPCHNMPAAIEAPAVLLVTPDEDDRVAPWHSYKLLALWQASSVSGNPVLLLGEKHAGHRGRAAMESAVAREANIWSFLFWQLGVESGRGGAR